MLNFLGVILKVVWFFLIFVIMVSILLYCQILIAHKIVCDHFGTLKGYLHK